MERALFDRLTVTLADSMARGSRRRALQAFAAALTAGALPALALQDLAAKGKRNRNGNHKLSAAKKKKGKGKGKKCKGKNKKKPKCQKGGGGDNGKPRFTVSGRQIRDPQGNPVLLRGVNKMSIFDEEDPTGEVYFDEIAKTGANTVRIVWLTSGDTGTLETLITNAKNAGLLPMIELHDATGEWSGLGNLVDYWARKSVVQLITKHQDSLLVNIGNEVGDASVSNNQFIDGYSAAVRRLRKAGIHTPLVIDAADWGKNLDQLDATAATLLDADPDHNLIFSVHLYWSIAGGADANFITTNLQEAVDANYPLIVGEFTVTGGVDPDTFDSTCLADGNIDYQTILQRTAEHQIGWYAWEWGPGNGFGGENCAVMDMTTDGLFANLKPGWATDVVNRIQAEAQPILG